jgi:deoxycytidylate deaminase
MERLIDNMKNIFSTRQKVEDTSPLKLEIEGDRGEIVIALVAAVGSDLKYFTDLIVAELENYSYSTDLIRISEAMLKEFAPAQDGLTRLKQIEHFMTAGNEYRKLSENNSALAYGAIAEISKIRLQKLNGEEPAPIPNNAWIIRSLKHPKEVEALRKTYGDSLFIIGIYSEEETRMGNLAKMKVSSDGDDFLENLLKRDADEGPSNGHGQHTSDTFHLADFFVNADKQKKENGYDIERIFKLIFSNPYVTPTFDEYAMYMAFSASTRSADLSRQVGAVLCKDSNILSTGANDVPKAHGGLYWPTRDDSGKLVDLDGGRDYTRGVDANKEALSDILEDLLKRLDLDYNDEVRRKLKDAKISDITEYGRVVHAEMEALLSCGRSNNSTLGTELYCTTFPCHNCAKHIIAAGVKRVVYVEPYSKSKASDFHKDSVSFKSTNSIDTVSFEPFVGVGPRNFLNLFSMNLGSGTMLKRKDKEGKVLDWQKESAILRIQPDPLNYISQEALACSVAATDLEKYKSKKN